MESENEFATERWVHFSMRRDSICMSFTLIITGCLKLDLVRTQWVGIYVTTYVCVNHQYLKIFLSMGHDEAIYNKNMFYKTICSGPSGEHPIFPKDDVIRLMVS